MLFPTALCWPYLPKPCFRAPKLRVASSACLDRHMGVWCCKYANPKFLRPENVSAFITLPFENENEDDQFLPLDEVRKNIKTENLTVDNLTMSILTAASNSEEKKAAAAAKKKGKGKDFTW